MHSVLRTNNWNTGEEPSTIDVALGQDTNLPSSVDHVVRLKSTRDQTDIPRFPTHPSTWEYRPLFLRPSPNSSMKIRGVRNSSSTEYLKEYDLEHDSLPINSGNEQEGKCLVIDFTTSSFQGTALFRIKLQQNKSSESDGPNQDYYFAGRKRTFQAVIKGKFLLPIPISQCVTGQVFERPPAKLPPKFILHGAESLFKKLAPQLAIDLDGKRPKFLSPLASTAQTVVCDDANSEGIERDMREPDQADPKSLHQHLTNHAVQRREPTQKQESRLERKRSIETLLEKTWAPSSTLVRSTHSNSSSTWFILMIFR